MATRRLHRLGRQGLALARPLLVAGARLQGTRILVLVLAASLASVAPAAAEPTLEGTVDEFLDDLSRGNVAAAMERLDDQPSYRGLWVCEPEPCVGRAAVLAALTYEAADATRFRLAPGSVETDAGSAVRARGEMRCASLVDIADRVVFDLHAEGAGGVVTRLWLTPDPTDPPTRRVLDEVAAVQGWLDDAAAAGVDGPIVRSDPGP